MFFLIANWFLGREEALVSFAFASTILTTWRIKNKQGALSALVGSLFGLLLAGISYLNEIPELIVYQDIIQSVVIIIALLASIILKKPLVALTSRVVRRWPANWYKHPKVRPAYMEVTWIWVVFSVLKLIVQIELLTNSISRTDLTIRILLGWPLTIILLILSYLYGIRRLRNLGGPSVEEFKNKTQPPWKSQQSGF